VTCGKNDPTCVVKVDLISTCATKARWAIVTVGYRLVRQGTALVSGKTTVEWDLKDEKGSPIANGLYWFTIREEGGAIRRTPILALR
jgi:hypothetical protein